MEEKLSSRPRHSALACRARLPCTLRRDPWGSEASRALHRHRGGPNLKMLPLSLRAEVLHSLTATASPRGKKMEGWVGAPAPISANLRQKCFACSQSVIRGNRQALTGISNFPEADSWPVSLRVRPGA